MHSQPFSPLFFYPLPIITLDMSTANDLLTMDPSLLTPAQRVRRNMQLRSYSTQSETPMSGLNAPGSSTPSASSESDAPSPSAEEHRLCGPLFAPASDLSLSAMVTLATAAKADLELSPKYGAMLDKYIRASPAEQRLLAVAYTLKTAQQLEKSMRSERIWGVSLESPETGVIFLMKKTLRTYSMIFLTSPHLSSFRGPIADAIISALREIGFDNIPQAHEIAKLDIVRKVLNDHLTQDRYTIKKKLDASVKSESPTANIALLTRNICKKFGIAITIEIMSRIAFLRWSLRAHPDIEVEEFWIYVDRDLSEYRGAGGLKNPNVADMWQAFRFIYEEDVEMFGEPSVTDVQFVSAATLVGNQYTVVDRWARTVQPILNSADKGPNKRARTDTEDSDDTNTAAKDRINEEADNEDD
ncbi:hypothetical protein EV361DRAFT_1037204 [Lentinula raphanica]|nr:hypothetical protein EV361DRAFT_1037204 [Lentinula raphanica]